MVAPSASKSFSYENCSFSLPWSSSQSQEVRMPGCSQGNNCALCHPSWHSGLPWLLTWGYNCWIILCVSCLCSHFPGLAILPSEGMLNSLAWVSRVQLPMAMDKKGHCGHGEDIPEASLRGPLQKDTALTYLASTMPCSWMTGISHCLDNSLSVVSSLVCIFTANPHNLGNGVKFLSLPLSLLEDTIQCFWLPNVEADEYSICLNQDRPGAGHYHSVLGT